ncbi:MAG TPA: hypothetical protein VKV26_19835 [Dehalococcoidia bacterium]|nr:hypothetical protein [Dehalococcoidia bacterium]
MVTVDPRINFAPSSFDPARDLPPGFMDFLTPLHRDLTPRQQALVRQRAEVLAEAHAGRLPAYLPPSDATRGDWRIELPAWSLDQRNQMTGPADEAELVVKMLNSGAPAVMLDLEDSMANTWPHLLTGVQNIRRALRGELTYEDQKRGRAVGIEPSGTVIFTRARGLHLNQGGVFSGELMAAALLDVALVCYQAEPAALRHPLCFYIPKSESAQEALWWRDLFDAIEEARGWPRGWIRCMALVEAHPLAFQMEEFIYNLRGHIIGLNLGRWDYMASLIHFNLNDPAWVLPDRNTIPHDVPFFQNLRTLLPEICHKRGIFAIGGMTALYPSRTDADLNARALRVLAEDKHNEAACLMDGAWTGHPDQNAIAVQQFPAPNQLQARRPDADLHPDLRPLPTGVGRHSLQGTRAAVRTVIRYRHGVLSGRGASLLDGYMEDLATDRIYRLMLAQRAQHHEVVTIMDDADLPLVHTPVLITRLFDEELTKILAELPAGTPEDERARYREARRQSEAMIVAGRHDPV